MCSIFLQSGVPRHFLWKFIAVWIYNVTVFMFMYVNDDLKPSRQYAETWVFGMFSCCVRQGKYILGFGKLTSCWCIYVYCILRHVQNWYQQRPIWHTRYRPIYETCVQWEVINCTNWKWLRKLSIHWELILVFASAIPRSNISVRSHR